MTTQFTQPLGVGIIGAGGFAQIHHDRILKLEKKGLLKLLATADPNSAKMAEAQEKFQFNARGVRCFDDYKKMLVFLKEQNAAYVTIPTPVPLHAEMHAAVVDAQLGVYLEKPPTLDLPEFERMIEVEKRAVRQTNVGFNFIIEPARQATKKRLLAGEFGKIESLQFTAFWPRPESYYARAGWAGKLRVNGRWVLDSCLTNAVSHNVHNMLFWAGQKELMSWARPESVQSVMVRAHNIESTDTVFVKAILDSGAELRIGMTHAIDGAHAEHERIVCQNAVIEYSINPNHMLTITWKNGKVEQFGGLEDTFESNQAAYAHYTMGQSPRPITRLEDCRAFVELATMAFAASGGIKTIPVTPVSAQNGVFRPIPGIKDALTRFCDTGEFPQQLNGVSLAGPAIRQGRGDMMANLEKII